MKKVSTCQILAGTLLCTPILQATGGDVRHSHEKYNVLLILVDDLRPQLSCYGAPVVQSPNIDKLASQGVVFNHAYAQMALCSPSRISLLTGMRPETHQILDIETNFRTKFPDLVSLPQMFIQNGYEATGLSKVYHQMGGTDIGSLNDIHSWTLPHWNPNSPAYGPIQQELVTRMNDSIARAGGDLTDYKVVARGAVTEAPDVSDNTLQDGKTADKAIEILRQWKDKPFFLAVGFVKPHLPLVAPKKYWDIYSPDDLPLAANDFPPIGSPEYAWRMGKDFYAYTDVPPVYQRPSKELEQRLVHGYLACISYVDVQIGKILAELEGLKLKNKTIVVFCGDHGFQIGEHDKWGNKHSNYETSTRIPLIISVPGMKNSGVKTDAIVETIDIFPTLGELCKLQVPASAEGKSLLPVLNAPEKKFREAAFHLYPTNIPGIGRSIGRSMIDGRYHLVIWSVPPKGFYEYELFDHRVDPQENINLAKHPSYQKKLEELILKFNRLAPKNLKNCR